MSTYKDFHRITQLLTLYLQRRWEEIALYNNVTWPGRVLLPTLVPADEQSLIDYTQTDPGAGVSASSYESFWLPRYLLSDRLEIKGTGYAVIRFSTWTAVAGGTITLTWMQVRMRALSSPGVFRPINGYLINKTLTGINWANTNTGETKRSFLIELPDIDTYLDRDEVLECEIGRHVDTLVQAGHTRHLYKRGEAESYIMLPVKES